MNTNNRNVRLQWHGVLLTVMQRAGDLIKKNDQRQRVIPRFWESKYRLRISLAHLRNCHFAVVQ